MEMKKGVFFSLDALIALILIIGLIIVSYSLVNDTRTKTEVHYDILETLSILTAGESADALTQSLIAQGTISDANRSLLEVVGELYVTNRSLASQALEQYTQEIDTPYNWGIWYGSTLLMSKNTTSLEEAKQIDVARGFVSGIREGESVTGFSSRAFLSTNHKTKYVYSGGYVGDGNITFNVSYQGNITAARLELATNTNASIYVNGNFAGTLQASQDTITPRQLNLTLGLFHSGDNLVELRGGKIYSAGGFVKIEYISDVEYQETPRYQFPGIEGIVNLYDGVYIPSNVSSMKLSLHYNSSQKLTLTLGNVTIFNQSSLVETTTVKDNAELTTLLNYNQLSGKTLPLRLWIENISLYGQNATAFDVVLITDTSGSMDWRLDSDTTGTTRTCADANLYSPSTKRISLAKCLDREFIDTILNASNDSRVALVQFSTHADSYVSLTRNNATLVNSINSYTANGATCVSCAINRAYEILKSESTNNRLKFVIVMTDGVTNQRSTATCTDLLTAGGALSKHAVGGTLGQLLVRNITYSWNQENSPTVSDMNDMDFHNNTYGFAVGDGGLILRYNGTSWLTQTSPVASDLHGISVYNATYALAVGASGRVVRYNGTGWSLQTTISNSPTLNAVSIWNATLAMAAGLRSSQGRVYKTTNGATWTEDSAAGSNTNLRGIKILASNLAFAVGDNGLIRRWTGSSWSTQTSTTSDALYAVDGKNSTFAFAVGGTNGRALILRYNGASWSEAYDDSSQDTLRDVETKETGQAVSTGDGGLIIEYNGTWTRTFDIPPAYRGNNTAGISCTIDNDACTETDSFPALNAEYSACRARTEGNSTLYSIGFGPVASCGFATQTLQAIASCGNGTMYTSNNATELKQFYQNIAQSIIQISYAEQTSAVVGNITTHVYPDSYIEFNYTQPPRPYGLAITTEVPFTSSGSTNFTLPQNVTLYEAYVVSYSGPRWTTRATINGNEFYNLNTYGQDYVLLGDPYAIYIPKQLINATNTVTLQTGVSPSNISSGSASNKVVHTVVRNTTGYSPIAINAEGCTWLVDIEQGANVTFMTPQNYTGSNQCYYQATHFSFDQNDAIQSAVSQLFAALDFDGDYRIDVPLVQGDVQIGVNQITGIPFSWSTEVQVRLWR